MNTETTCVEKQPLTDAYLEKMNAYWRAANYLSAAQLYLLDNPLLREPLKPEHIKKKIVGHWGTVPGQNFVYCHMNRAIKKYDLDMVLISGPGHGGNFFVSNSYLEGTYSEVYPNVSEDMDGLKKLCKQFSFPGGISSHVAPETPGSINEGGELGYSIAHAFGSVFDNPDLITTCIVGDGEAETGPLATAWHSNKFLNPVTDGAVLPILHLNGYKISNPTIFSRISHDEIESFFHGCGWKLVPEALRGLGVKNLYCVEQQMVLDGTFPTVASPNPENPEGFYLAIELADKVGADFILGTDPDSDRVGIMVRGADGKFIAVTGNQTGVLLLDYLIGAMRRAGKMPEHPYFLKTIVTTEMARKVAESNDVTCCDTFTGFKFMAEKKNALEAAGEGHVIMSYEESYGYMLGDYVRDKDAVTASLLITEMAAWYAAKGMTLYDALQALYKKYGWYGEKTHNLVMPGLDGLEKMAALMERLRTAPPANIAGVDVVVRKDYQDGSAVDCATGNVGKMELSGSNVLRFELADGTTILVRPSGTEPKIKVYILTKGVDAAERDANIEKYSAWVKTLTE